MSLVKTPRDYQIEAVKSLYDYWSRKSGNPLIAMPTGTGKALVIALFLKSIYDQWPGQRVLMLTHVKELVAQNYAELKELWPEAPAGIYSAGLGRKETYFSITFAGIASIIKAVHLLGRIDLVGVDEAHLVNPSAETMYAKLIAALKEMNPNVKIFGLTATAYRLGHGRLTDGDGIFTDTCFDITGMQAFNRLLEEGYLAPLVPKPTRALLDIDGVGLVGGEFNQTKLQIAVDRDEVTEAAIREAIEMGQDRHHWLIFASGIEHADHICEMLNHMGIPAVCVHSKLPGGDDERDANIKAFKAGKVRAVVNNNVLTTGFNYPEIDMIVMLRPTMSTVLWVQMLGRGTRPAPWAGKVNCLVLDFARNSVRLGPINDPVIPRKKGEGGGTAPIKECPTCCTYIHASLRFCNHCGHEFVFAHKLETSAASAELIKVDLPIIEDFKIDHITASIHRKIGSPEMLKVAYYSGISKVFYDYIGVEHKGFAQGKAQTWWRERAPEDLSMPATTREAIQLFDQLRPVTHLRVWVNKKYPEIRAYCFDGTAFGKQFDDGSHSPSLDVHAELAPVQPSNLMDDDIPF